VGISLASYLGWTPPCAHFVDGVQGRYFIPLIPLALLVVSGRFVRSEVVVGRCVIVVAAIANIAALAMVASRYYA
jgi:uncharacterized membrane protein